MVNTDKVTASLREPVAFSVPRWVVAATLPVILGLLVGFALWLSNSATQGELVVQKLDQQVKATNELKAEVRELRLEASSERKQLREEVNSLRERVAALEAK